MFYKLLLFVSMLVVFETVLTTAGRLFSRQHRVHNDDFQYTTETYPIEMAKKDHLVMFYTTWCTHFQRLQPTWNRLARQRNRRRGSPVRIAKVNCGTDPALCTANHVNAYPTIMFFRAGDDEGIRYNDTYVSVKLFNRFINAQS